MHALDSPPHQPQHPNSLHSLPFRLIVLHRAIAVLDVTDRKLAAYQSFGSGHSPFHSRLIRFTSVLSAHFRDGATSLIGGII